MKGYRQYRWFYTRSSKLVVGGKSAVQNDRLLQSIVRKKETYYVMHTSDPGSPFCVIVAPMDEITKRDLVECAVFCGCFSQAWKKRKKKTRVDVFTSDTIMKQKNMKTGTWSVTGKIQKMEILLELALVKQKRVLRAVPLQTVNKSDVLLRVIPGTVDKSEAVHELLEQIGESASKKDELLSALPAGGAQIRKN